MNNLSFHITDITANSIRANASEIGLSVKEQDTRIVIRITDNGGGFSRSKMQQNTAEGHRSIGLQNIAGRIALSGGSFRIVSCPGLGTTARIILPMKGEEHIC